MTFSLRLPALMPEQHADEDGTTSLDTAGQEGADER